MSCNGGGVAYLTNLNPDEYRNLSTTTSHTVTPVHPNAAPARMIQKALELEMKTILIDGEFQIREVPRCDLNGTGATLRKIQLWLDQNTPGIDGRVFDEKGIPVSELARTPSKTFEV